MSIGSSIATLDMSAAFGGLADLPDAVAHVTTLPIRNQDSFSSEYGLKGADYDYKWLVRNTRESPRVGYPIITRHNAVFTMTKRPVFSGGSTSQLVPYEASFTVRFPETGTAALAVIVAANLAQVLLEDQGAILQKMFNFES